MLAGTSCGSDDDLELVDPSSVKAVMTPPKFTLENREKAKGIVHVNARPHENLLAIHVEFDSPVALVNKNDQAYELTEGSIKLKNGTTVPAAVMNFYYIEDKSGENNLSFEYKVDGMGDWDFITVRFIDINDHHAETQKSALGQTQRPLIHVKESTVHYGDAD